MFRNMEEEQAKGAGKKARWVGGNKKNIKLWKLRKEKKER